MIFVQNTYWSFSKLVSEYPGFLYFEYLLLFILFFSLIYDALVLSKMFIKGESEEDDSVGRKINIIVAASLSILALRNPFIINALTRSVSSSTVVLLPLALFIFLVASFTAKSSGEAPAVVRGILYIIGSLIVLWLFLGNIIGEAEFTQLVLHFLGITGPKGKIIWMVIILIVTAIIILLIAGFLLGSSESEEQR